MTPREKAEQLYNRYFFTQYPIVGSERVKIAKDCCLIAIDEVLSVVNLLDELRYWKEVKQEIEAI